MRGTSIPVLTSEKVGHEARVTPGVFPGQTLMWIQETRPNAAESPRGAKLCSHDVGSVARTFAERLPVCLLPAPVGPPTS